MGIVSDRRYEFDLTPAEFWAAIEQIEDYRRWWRPWLRRFDADALAEGDMWRCAVAPPVPYVVRFSMHLTEVTKPSKVAVAVTGDIVGSADLTITESPAGCRVRLRSDLSPANIILRGVMVAARPVAQFGHDWVLDTGARQFVRFALG